MVVAAYPAVAGQGHYRCGYGGVEREAEAPAALVPGRVGVGDDDCVKAVRCRRDRGYGVDAVRLCDRVNDRDTRPIGGDAGGYRCISCKTGAGDVDAEGLVALNQPGVGITVYRQGDRITYLRIAADMAGDSYVAAAGFG